ncbi:hypothetical protein CHUAL_005025 [Chamberlinius hualienensis]
MRTIALISIISILSVNIGDTYMIDTLNQCCDLGKARAVSGQQCEGHSGGFPRIPRHQQAMCSTTLSICCLAHYRRLMCINGITAARQSQLCVTISGTAGGEYFKDCCDACKLGIATRNSADISSCEANSEFSFDYPWADAYRECCLRTNHTAINITQLNVNTTLTTTLAPPVITTSTDSQPSQYTHHTGFQDTQRSSSSASNSYPSFINVTAAPFSSPSSSVGTIADCQQQPNFCDHVCVDTPTGHYCQCHTGYALQSDGRTCTSTSGRCIRNNPCEQLCLDTGEAIICNCKYGYKLNNDHKSCTDIDECAEDDHDCDWETQMCVNTIGSHECIDKPNAAFEGGERALNSDITDELSSQANCDNGYQYDHTTNECEDIDECGLGIHSCDQRTQFCTNEIGSYSCHIRQTTSQCPPGYEYNQTIASCVDVNECENGQDACDRTREFCFNLQGLYECKRKSHSNCPAGYKFSQSGKSCEDVDECEENIHNCDPVKETCRNTEGGYECDIKCDAGYRYSAAFGMCADIDECLENTHNCVKEDGLCINTLGSYECSRRPKAQCPAGYKPSETDGSCIDVDECAEKSHSCDEATEECVNEIGQYQCIEKVIQCQEGFRPDSINPKSCVDVDECLEKKHNCVEHKEECVNTAGNFECHTLPPRTPDCPSGHFYNTSISQCQDINECELKNDTCDRSKEICLNTNGSFRCWLVACPTGYRPNTTAKACEDVDECAEHLHNCSSREVCENFRGGFNCVAAVVNCSQGYRYNPSTSKCEDIDECQQQLHTCNLTISDCRNTPGGFICPKRPQCPSGYRYVNVDGRRCLDVDECAENLHNCKQDVERCVNTRGSYRCLPYNNIRTQQPQHNYITTTTPRTTTITTTSAPRTTATTTTSYPTRQTVNYDTQYCQPGYRFNFEQRMCVDINECQQGSHTCQASQRCDNTIGSFTCIRLTGCGTGYTLNAHTNQCEDDDECELGNHNCGHLYQCRNTLGSFRCDRKTCPYGHRLILDGSCQATTCDSGTKPDPNGNCVDINECDTPNICRSYERCINSQGSYRCQSLVNCGPGYELDPQGATCVDVDECVQGNHECRGGQQCINRAGGYLCQCPTGYFLNFKRECEDIDECTRYGKVCAQNSECQNTPGSYHCVCKEGFQHGENDRTCVDVDECKQIENICQHKCVNTWGSYQCTCNSGYTLADDKRACHDVDECALYKGHGSLCVGHCVNEPGSFSCSCPHGYTLGADKRTCQDIDECSEPNVCKGENEVCLNTRGGYKCNQISCPPGYVKDTAHKNRCKRESSVCRQGDLECIKQPLSYSYNYLTFASNLPIPPVGYINLFTMRGPPFQDIGAEFNLEMPYSRSYKGVNASTLDYFYLRRTGYNQGIISLVKSISGPQDVELILSMNLYRGSVFGGVAVAKLYIYVTEYEF